jgi:hypothetical protein
MAASSIEINANRDWGVVASLKQFNAATGAIVPRTTGTVIAFITASKAPNATPLDPSLQVNALHIGNGKWTIAFDGTGLTDALLSALPSGQGYLMIDEAGDEWSYVPLNYVPSKLAKIQ